MTGQVLVDRAGDVLTLTLSNPGRRNALTFPMYQRLEEQCRSAASDASLRILVLRGADGHFAGGTDISDLERVTNGNQGIQYEAFVKQVQQSLLDLRVPVIALVEGVCVGGGLVLAALSDIVYCTPDARFGSPIAQTLGNTLSATSLARLYSCFGRRRTTEMLMTGTLFDAEAAKAAGFVTAVVESAEMPNRLATTISEVRRCAAASIWSFKELERRIDRALSDIPVDDVYDQIYGSSDFREGVTAFLQRRRPGFGGAQWN